MNQLFEGGPQTVSLWKLIKMELYMDPDRQVEIQYIYMNKEMNVNMKEAKHQNSRNKLQ